MMRPDDDVKQELAQLWSQVRENEQAGALHGQECNADRVATRQRIDRVEQALGNALTPGMTSRLQTTESKIDSISDDIKEIKESAQWTRRHLLTVAGALVAAIVIALVNYVLNVGKTGSGGTTTH